MDRTARALTVIAGLAIFIGLPLLFYALGDAPRRTLLKEVISVATLLAVSMMLGQYFLARSNVLLLSMFKAPQIQKFHKLIAYTAVAVILVHPFLIVLPRFFEGGIKPWDALVTMITTFDNLGLMLGFFAYLILLVLAVTAFFRKRLIPHFTHRYRGWRYFHGGLAAAFTVLALWHAIALGRHTDVAMSAFFIICAGTGFALLARLYWGGAPKASTPKGASA